MQTLRRQADRRDGFPRQALQSRLGFRQPGGQGSRQDASQKEDSLLRLRGQHQSAHQHRQARTQRASDDRGRSASPQRLARATRSHRPVARRLARQDGQPDHDLRELSQLLTRFLSARLCLQGAGREHQQTEGGFPRRRHLALHATGLRYGRHRLQPFPSVLHRPGILGQ